MSESRASDRRTSERVGCLERWNRFRAGREQWTEDQLQPYWGDWVAFTADGRQILAHDADLGEVYRLLDEMGYSFQDVMLDHLVYVGISEVGGVQFNDDEVPVHSGSDTRFGPTVAPAGDHTAVETPRPDHAS